MQLQCHCWRLKLPLLSCALWCCLQELQLPFPVQLENPHVIAADQVTPDSARCHQSLPSDVEKSRYVTAAPADALLISCIRPLAFPEQIHSGYACVPPGSSSPLQRMHFSQVWVGVVPAGPAGTALNSTFKNRDTPAYKEVRP